MGPIESLVGQVEHLLSPKHPSQVERLALN